MCKGKLPKWTKACVCFLAISECSCRAKTIEASIFEYDEEKEMMVDKWRRECLSIGIIIQT